MDNFEQFLKSQPLRDVPPEWRAEILAPATAASRESPASAGSWRGWLWPSPYAWGALAAVWLVIIGLNMAGQPRAERKSPRGSAPTEQEVFTALAERQRELAEIIPRTKVTVAPPLVSKPEKKGAGLKRREIVGSEIA